MITRLEQLISAMSTVDNTCKDDIELNLQMPDLPEEYINTYVAIITNLIQVLEQWSSSVKRFLEFKSFMTEQSANLLIHFLKAIWQNIDSKFIWKISWQEEQDDAFRLLDKIDFKLATCPTIYQVLFDCQVNHDIIYLCLQYLHNNDFNYAYNCLDLLHDDDNSDSESESEV
jgi:hypothetical protein